MIQTVIEWVCPSCHTRNIIHETNDSPFCNECGKHSEWFETNYRYPLSKFCPTCSGSGFVASSQLTEAPYYAIDGVELPAYVPCPTCSPTINELNTEPGTRVVWIDSDTGKYKFGVVVIASEVEANALVRFIRIDEDDTTVVGDREVLLADIGLYRHVSKAMADDILNGRLTS